ncbi:MAG: hypothetical protein MZU97_01270 [Bacillus subtilis]|nr:hypothetical protein [Bacillus subtilis]
MISCSAEADVFPSNSAVEKIRQRRICRFATPPTTKNWRVTAIVSSTTRRKPPRNTAVSIANAEAFLFQYYADLSAHLGKAVYLLLVDAASHEWNVLAIDNIQTYYPVAPMVQRSNAVTILPNIALAGSRP